MAAKGSFVRSYFPGNHSLVRQRIMAMSVASTGFPSSSWKKTRRLSCVIAINSGNKHGNLDMVNGEKVNGIHMVKSPIRRMNTERQMEIDRNQDVDDDDDKPLPSCFFGRFIEEKLVYRQTFSVRSYEIGPDKTATMETWMNLLQETALNHVTSSGLAGDGFGSTREMSLRKLIWVVTRINIQVQRYSRWGDIIEIDTWVDTEGKNGMRRDWIIRDHNTQEIITRATSTWVIMNRETRKLSKIPEQVRQELKPFYLNRNAIATEQNDAEKIGKLSDETADRIRSGLAPRWNDMDANQHVNNVKYIGWILESVPMNVLEDYSLWSMTLEYRRECRQSNVIESLTSTKAENSKETSNRKANIEYTHLLRMQADKSEIVRARTEWQSKINHSR